MKTTCALAIISIPFIVLSRLEPTHSAVAYQKIADAKVPPGFQRPDCGPTTGGDACAHCKDEEIDYLFICGTDSCTYTSECVATCVGVGVADPESSCPSWWG